MCCPYLGEKQIVRLKCSSLKSCSDSVIKFIVLFDLSFVPFRASKFLVSVCSVNCSGEGKRAVGGRGEPDSIIWPPVIICAQAWRRRGVFTGFGWSSSGSARDSLSQRASELVPVASLCLWRTMEAPPSNLPPPPDSTWRLRGQRRTNIGVPDIDCVALLGRAAPLSLKRRLLIKTDTEI